jgi:hypothetical protein
VNSDCQYLTERLKPYQYSGGTKHHGENNTKEKETNYNYSKSFQRTIKGSYYKYCEDFKDFRHKSLKSFFYF